jgi:ABC-type polysaccharide/polyol phosphate transport system ATPase subunit
MSGTAIEVQDVAKKFRLVHERQSSLKATILNGFRRSVHEDFWALNDVSLQVPQGSTYGLIGHNGSGKSTLLKCMARIYRPDRGEISYQGRMSALLELGAGFHPELSGRENVYLNGSILGMSKRDIDQHFDDIVEFAGLEQFIDTPVKNYSSGMFVRLGFSIAITVEPDILLVDEILAVGDESFQTRCMEKFADLRRAGRTVVLVSHSLDSVRSMCDRAAWLDHGQLVKEGDAYDVATSYLEQVHDERRAKEALSGGVTTEEDARDGWHLGEVKVLSHNGKEIGATFSGSEVTLQVEFESPEATAVALAIGVYRTDGVHVAGPVHRFRVEPGKVTANYRIPKLALAAGTYDIAVRLLDDHLQSSYANRRRAARLDVESGAAADIGGVVALGGEWDVP